MNIKVKFKAIEHHGGIYTFIEDIDVPDDLTSVEEQDQYIDDLDKSHIMISHELPAIIDFWRYVKKPRAAKTAKQPTWKEISKLWETNCKEALESAEFWKHNSETWKGYALKYREIIEQNLLGKVPYFKEDIETIIDIKPKQNSLDTGLPVDITKGYSGGWLAPNGDFYGMDGDYAEMIHAQLGDKLLELGIIPEEEDGFHNPDSWLCNNGWVKIHFDWVLYEGYLRAKRTKIQDDYNMPVIQAIPMTKEQRKQIAIYGEMCYDGALKFGLEKNHISIARFKMTESPMIWKLFDY